MVKITGRGVAAGMRNLMAMREADRQEKNRKEAQTERRLTSLETKMDKILEVMEKIANG